MAYNLEIKPTLILITSGEFIASDYQQLRQLKQNIRRHKILKYCQSGKKKCGPVADNTLHQLVPKWNMKAHAIIR